MNKLFLFIALLFLGLWSAAQAKTADSPPVEVDGTIRFVVPYQHTFSEELLKVLLTVNDKLLYVATLKAETEDQPVMFSVSKYMNDNRVSIQEAFDGTVKFRPDVAGYELLGHGTEQVAGRILRYKISNVSYDGSEVASIMYYFMNNDASEALYELKVACSRQELEKYRKALRSIAASLTFIAKP